MTVVEQDSSQLRQRALLGLTIVGVAGAIWAYGDLVYGSGEGIASIGGEVSGAFLIALAIGYFINKRRFSKNLISVCLLIAVVAVFPSKVSMISEALEAREYQRIAAQAKSIEDLIPLSKEHPKNRFLAFVAEVATFRMAEAKKLSDLTAPLDAYDFACGSKLLERNRQSLAQCRDYFGKMEATIAETRQRHGQFAAQQRERVQALLSDVSNRFKFADPSFARGAQRGMENGLSKTDAFSKEYLASLAELNSSYFFLFSYLVDHFNDYNVDSQTKRLLWRNNELLFQYNSRYKRAEEAETRLNKVVEGARAYDQQRLDRLLKP